MSKIGSLARACASPSQVYSRDMFYRHFVCGFHFRHSRRFPFAALLSVFKGLIMVSVGTMGSSLFEDNSFKTVKELVDYV